MSNGNKAVVVILILFILTCITLIYLGGMSDRESAFLTIIFTIATIAASWLISHAYHELSHDRSLRTYALKAAEKVNNLSKQLTAFSSYLAQGLEETEPDDVRMMGQRLASLTQRLEGAIHQINTLKSMNDGSLSDWEGVIGAELEKQREEQQERDEVLRDLTERVETLVTSLEESPEASQVETPAGIQLDIDAIKRTLLGLVASSSGVPVALQRSRRRSKTRVQIACPQCATMLTYRHRGSPSCAKAVKCKSCGARFTSHWGEDGEAYLEPRIMVLEKIGCPNCGELSSVELDTFRGSSRQSVCSNCDATLMTARTLEGVRTNILSAKPAKLTDELVDRIAKALPPQPWAKGVHHTVATQLKLPKRLVQKAIQKLIHNGVFLPQIDGQVYVPASNSVKTVDGSRETAETKAPQSA